MSVGGKAERQWDQRRTENRKAKEKKKKGLERGTPSKVLRCQYRRGTYFMKPGSTMGKNNCLNRDMSDKAITSCTLELFWQ